MNKAFGKASARAGMIAVMETLHIGHGDPVIEATIESVYKSALREARDGWNEDIDDVAKDICLTSLQNRYDDAIEHEEDFFEEMHEPYDRKAMMVAVLGADFLEAKKHRTDFKSVGALGPRMVERATAIWQTSKQYLEECRCPKNNPSPEALYCASVTLLNRIRSFGSEIDTYDVKDQVNYYDQEIRQQTYFLGDTELEIGRELMREHEFVRVKLVRNAEPFMDRQDQPGQHPV